MEVIKQAFDEPAQRHSHGGDGNQPKDLQNIKKMLPILLDQSQDLGRAYNAVIPSSGSLTGGVDANALQRPKRFFEMQQEILKKVDH